MKQRENHLCVKTPTDYQPFMSSKHGLLCMVLALTLEKVTQEGIEYMLDVFFKNKSPADIEWYELGEESDEDHDRHSPMYTMHNDKHYVMIWPTRYRGTSVLGLELREERPDLEGQISWVGWN